jgi:hypothetical protein
MPIIRPKQLAELEDDEPYQVRISGWEWGVGGADYGSKPQLVVELDLGDGDTVLDYVRPALGTQRDGRPSKLTQLCNAVVGQPATTTVKWFNTDSLEFGYEDGRVDGQIKSGDQVVIRGMMVARKEGPGKRFKVEKYQMMRTAARPARRAPGSPAIDRPAQGSDLAPDLKPGDAAPEETTRRQPQPAQVREAPDDVPF